MTAGVKDSPPSRYYYITLPSLLWSGAESLSLGPVASLCPHPQRVQTKKKTSVTKTCTEAESGDTRKLPHTSSPPAPLHHYCVRSATAGEHKRPPSRCYWPHVERSGERRRPKIPWASSGPRLRASNGRAVQAKTSYPEHLCARKCSFRLRTYGADARLLIPWLRCRAQALQADTSQRLTPRWRHR